MNTGRLLLTLALGAVFLCGLSSYASEVGTVTGKVQFIRGQAILPKKGATLEFSAESGTYITHSDPSGKYELAVPGGQHFHVTVQGFGACELSRASFSVGPGEHVVLDFVGVLCPYIEPKAFPPPVPLEGELDQYPTNENPCAHPADLPVWYWEQKLVLPAKPDMLLSFGHCIEREEETIYFSLDPTALVGAREPVRSLPLRATVSVNTSTIRADQIVFHRAKCVFYFVGDVTFEDGAGKTVAARTARLSFSAGIPKIETDVDAPKPQ